jgi:hypothetical protein
MSRENYLKREMFTTVNDTLNNDSMPNNINSLIKKDKKKKKVKNKEPSSFLPSISDKQIISIKDEIISDKQIISIKDEILKESPNVNRYMECYLDEKSETVTTFDPVLYITNLMDLCNSYKKELYICNREPYCDCKDVQLCLCDDDDHSRVTFTIDIVSNCMCNVFITLSNQKYKLDKSFFWRMFGIKDDETPLMDINTIDHNVTFYIHNLSKPTQSICFDIDECPRINSGCLSFQFNYMNFQEHQSENQEHQQVQ